MAELVKVVVDAMGGDLAPVEPVKAAVEAVKEREKEVFQKEEFDKLGKIDYHRKKADENITRRLIKTTLGKWKDEYKAQTI